MDWKIIMFDREVVKTMNVIWSLSILFSPTSNLKNWSPKKYKVKGHNMHNSNQFMVLQNLLYKFFKWTSNFIFFPPSPTVFEAHFQEPSTLENQDLQWTPWHKILNRKIIIIHFQNQIFDSETRLHKEFFKNIQPLKIENW